MKIKNRGTNLDKVCGLLLQDCMLLFSSCFLDNFI
jgi:hypothetical protein